MGMGLSSCGVRPGPGVKGFVLGVNAFRVRRRMRVEY